MYANTTTFSDDPSTVVEQNYLYSVTNRLTINFRKIFNGMFQSFFMKTSFHTISFLQSRSLVAYSLTNF